MYLRFDTDLKFPVLGRRLCPDADEQSFGHDYENVYEWMYVDLPGLPYSLNVSREHGWADIEDESLYVGREHEVKPGPTFAIGWNRTTDEYVGDLPSWLPQYFADRLSLNVDVFVGRHNVDAPDPEPTSVVHPQ